MADPKPGEGNPPDTAAAVLAELKTLGGKVDSLLNPKPPAPTPPQPPPAPDPKPKPAHKTIWQEFQGMFE